MSEDNTNIYAKIEEYYRTGLILDTGPLILLLSGKYNYESLGKTPLTYEFTKEDYDLLVSFVSRFKRCIITPHVLVETYNRIHTKFEKNKFSEFITKVTAVILSLTEVYISKEDIFARNEVKNFGITDTGILLESEKEGYLILTKDLPFSQLCQSRNVLAIHFDQLRADSWY